METATPSLNKLYQDAALKTLSDAGSPYARTANSLKRALSAFSLFLVETSGIKDDAEQVRTVLRETDRSSPSQALSDMRADVFMRASSGIALAQRGLDILLDVERSGKLPESVAPQVGALSVTLDAWTGGEAAVTQDFESCIQALCRPGGIRDLVEAAYVELLDELDSSYKHTEASVLRPKPN